jgi:urease accessory protein
MFLRSTARASGQQTPAAQASFPFLLVLAGAIGASLLMPLPAQAHHFMELNQLQPTVLNGLLSGLAHPLIGPDHLLFLLALSLLGLRHSGRWMLALLAVGLGGAGLGLLWPGLPGAEVLVAATLTLEALVLLGWLPLAVIVPAMALHGYVLSDAVLGWTAMPIGSYLIGLLVSQGLLLLLALQALRPLAERLSPTARRLGAFALAALSLTLIQSAGMG